MRKTAIVTLIVGAVAMAGTQVALGASVHLKKKPPLTFTVLGSGAGKTLNASGSLSGLGNGDIVVTITATADPTATCTNGGQHQAPGQNPAPVTLTGVQAIPQSQVKNGTVGFSVTTGNVVTPVAGAPDCPNSNWTEDIIDLTFTDATITVYQPCSDSSPPIDCPVVLSQSFSGPF